MPGVVGVYLTGEPVKGVGPQDVALAIIGAVFKNGYVKNKVMEFVGPGVASLSADFRIGIDVMTTETTCLSSIWVTDEEIEEFYEIHGRKDEYRKLAPGQVAYYDGLIMIDLSEIRPMIAMPFHPSNTYTIEELNANLTDILHDVEQKALVSLDGAVEYSLMDKVRDGKFHVDQGIIAGCAGGGHSERTLYRFGCVHLKRISGFHACLHGADQKRSGGSDPGDGRGHEDGLLRSLLRCGRYPGKQRLQHPPFHQKLPEQRGKQAAERTDRFRRPDGRPFHRGNRGQQGRADPCHGI